MSPDEIIAARSEMRIKVPELESHSIDEFDEMLRQAARMLADQHVLPEIGERGAQLLRAAVRDGTYRHAYSSPGHLAELLTRDLRMASGDHHLFIEYLGDAAAPADDWIARWRREGPARNWGISAVRLMPGNIGFIKITSFYTYALASAAVGAAMELVRHTAGLILDVTDNGGGDDETADAVMDTFLAEGAPPPLWIESRTGRERDRSPTELVWPRYGTTRPLAILVNQRTFSAPEAVAYALQQEGRAVVVGSPSAGGAHLLDEGAALPLGFSIGVPTRRPISRRSNTNWEGVGVQPDVVTPGDERLWRAWELLRQKSGQAER